MELASKFFGFYKKSGMVVRLLLTLVIPIMCALWIIGSFTKIDRLVMFMVGVIIGCILTYIFYPEVSTFINDLIEIVKQVIA